MLQQTTAAEAARAQPDAASPESRLSTLAQGMTGSEILKIAAEIRQMRDRGEEICNLTVGDFDPNEFRIPKGLERYVLDAVSQGETNYPPSNGIPALRQSVLASYRHWLDLDYPVESVLITAGSRPGIYGTFKTLVDAGDRVAYPVPSWNNNHYCYLVGGVPAPVECPAEESFLPTAARLAPAVRGARLLVLNSPLNPTGTVFTADALAEVCDLVLEENERRGTGERSLYVLYDQVYWMLTFGSRPHVDPVNLRPEMARYTVYVDGISKGFASTGLRVGWVVGPRAVIEAMSNFLGHVGAWAPRPEQIATARFLREVDAVESYREELARGVQLRLAALYDGLMAMKRDGLPVDAIEPMGAMYLSARFALNGLRSSEGTVLRTNEEIRRFLLKAAGLAAVPFQAFGLATESGWFRLSAGAVSPAEIERVLPRLRSALDGLSPR